MFSRGGSVTGGLSTFHAEARGVGMGKGREGYVFLGTVRDSVSLKYNV